MKVHRIDLTSARRRNANGVSIGHDKAFMSYRGELIGGSRQPLFAAARYLLARSLAEPSDLIQTFRNGVPCMAATVGRAADRSVLETASAGPRIVKFRSFAEDDSGPLPEVAEVCPA